MPRKQPLSLRMSSTEPETEMILTVNLAQRFVNLWATRIFINMHIPYCFSLKQNKTRTLKKLEENQHSQHYFSAELGTILLSDADRGFDDSNTILPQ